MRTAEQHPGTLRRHLLMNERVIVATRAHWASLIEPAVTAFTVFLLVGYITGVVEGKAAFELAQGLWYLVLLLIGRFLWKAAEWGNEWFAVTDRRLLKTFGLLTRNVAMMPLRKVTDMNYTRSPAGRILGYGAFELESAGQDQAMREIKWLPDPDTIYQRVGDAVFGASGRDPDDDLPDARRVYLPADPYAVESAPVDAFDPPPDRPLHPEDEEEDEPGADEAGVTEPDVADGDESTAWQVSREEPGRRVDAQDEDSTGPIPTINGIPQPS